MCTGTHPFIPAADTVRVTIQMLQDSQVIENVINIHAGHSLTAADVDDIAGGVAAWWHDTARTNISTSVALVGVIARDISNEGGYEKIDYSHAGDAGLATGDPMPNEVSWKVKFSTATSGRNGRGGPFSVGLARNQVEGNLVTTTYAGAVVTAWETLQEGFLLTGDFSLAIVSYCHDHAWRTTALVTDVNSIGYFDRVVDRQGRRGPGRGR